MAFILDDKEDVYSSSLRTLAETSRAGRRVASLYRPLLGARARARASRIPRLLIFDGVGRGVAGGDFTVSPFYIETLSRLEL